MDVNINHLRSFYTAVKEGSVSKAVERLMVSRPRLTGHVKRLEETIGVKLMVCEGNSIQLTRAGQALFRKASKVFREIGETESLLKHMSSRKEAELRIGCPETLVDRFMPKLLRDFEKFHPGIKTIVSPGKDSAMARSVEEGRNDLAVIRSRPANCRLNIRMIGTDELVLIASPWSARVRGEEMGVSDLAEVPFVLLREGWAVRDVMHEYLSEFKICPRTVLESSSIALLKEFVGRDDGVAFIERGLVEAELEQHLLKEVRVLEGGPPAMYVLIGYPNRKSLTPSARTFLRLLTQTGGMVDPLVDVTRGVGIEAKECEVACFE
jgi:LysR family transcriptional regulator, low CO2-responsive transcriptional regulator